MPPAPPQVLDLFNGASLRLLEPNQAEAIFATVDANRAHLREWLPWVDTSTETAHTRAFLEHHAGLMAAGHSFGYSMWQGGRVIGMIGVHDIVPALHCGAIGYWLARAAQGRGLVTEAVRRILPVCYGVYGLERVEIRCAVGNHRGSAIPERLGFTFEGVLRHAQLLHGVFIDLRLYSLLRGEHYKDNASGAS